MSWMLGASVGCEVYNLQVSVYVQTFEVCSYLSGDTVDLPSSADRIV
jgi:hypothetical protein